MLHTSLSSRALALGVADASRLELKTPKSELLVLGDGISDPDRIDVSEIVDVKTEAFKSPSLPAPPSP